MKSKTRCGRVTKKNEANLRGIPTKQKNAKVTRSEISTTLINKESPETCLCVDMNESDAIEASSPTPAALVIDEDIAFDELDVENSTINEPESKLVNQATFDDEGTNYYTCCSTDFCYE